MNASCLPVSEVRSSQRIPFVRPVHVLSKTRGAAPIRLFSSNLSGGGIFLRASRAFPPGTRLELFLEAAGRVLPFAEGEVVFVLPPVVAHRAGRLPGFGVKFTRMAPKARALLEALVLRSGAHALLGPPQAELPPGLRWRG